MRRRVIVGVLLVAAATFVGWVYRPVLGAKTIWLDDPQYVTDNPLVLNPSWESARRFLSEVQQPSTVAGYYQPLTMISLMVDVGLGGDADHLRPFHRTSLALHMLNTALVTVLLVLLFDEPYTAAMVGVLFGAHPLTVEPVAWITERKTLLAMFFALSSLVGYVKYARAQTTASSRAWYGSTALCYALALLSKPTSTPLPILFLLLDYWPLRRLDRRAVLEKVPLFAIGAIAGAVTIVSQQSSGIIQYPSYQSWTAVFLAACYNIVFYLAKMVWPVPLSAFYLRPDPMSATNPMLLVGVAGAVGLFVVVATSLRWTRAIFTGWLIYLVALLPTVGLLRVTPVLVSEKYAYLPSVGLLLVVGWGLAKCWAVTDRGTQRLARAALCVAALGLGAAEVTATRRYLAIWCDNEALYGYVHTHSPRAWYLQPIVGNVLARQGKYEAAAVHYLQAEQDEQVAGVPTHASLQQNLGNALFAVGRMEEAIIHYNKALALDPTDLGTMDNLGLALDQTGQPDDAIAMFRRVLRSDASDAVANNAIGRVLARRGNQEQAIAYFRAAIASKPDFAEAHVNLADALQALDRPRDAIDHYRKALELEPNDPNIHNNLAAALLQNGETEGAIAELRVALRLNPEDRDLQANLRAALSTRSAPAGP